MPSSSLGPQFGANPLHPAPMSPAERLDEVARLLALGYPPAARPAPTEKANDPNHLRGFGLDFAAEGSVSDTDTHAERRAPMTATSPVLKQIAGLPKLSHAELKALWREYFGVEPPAYRRGFLVRGLAHRLQELTYGGLKPAYQARLDAMIDGTEKPNGAGRPGRRPRQDVHLLEGTKLLREWRGVTHEVTVIDGGYEHQGKRYRSLSAVARAITGTQWSGPLFFGLRKTGSGR